MIAFGSIVFEPEPYQDCAEPGIRAAAEPDSEILVFANASTITRGYNHILETVAQRDDLEALVLVHPHARIDDPDFGAKVRTALADPEVAVVGAAGGRGVDGLAWWTGEISTGPVRLRYEDLGGGERPLYEWANPRPAPAQVDALDGYLLILSPWAVRTLRFDEDPWLEPAFDVDLCRQARAAGRTLLVADIGAVFHRPLGVVGDAEPWMLAHRQMTLKWDELPPEEDEDYWRPRARRAEADREAARAMGGFKVLGSDVQAGRLEAELEAMLGSPEWRLTAPLRWINRRRRGAVPFPSRERPADLLAGDHRLAGGHARALAQPGEPLGHPERAGLQ